MTSTRETPTRIQAEKRFPLTLSRSIVSIRNLYETSKEKHWNPESDIDWKTFNSTQYSPDELEAGRLVWSRRAWVEYARLSETPAVLIRFCLEAGRESDPKYFLTVRNTEEAWQVETYHRFAELMGGYIDRPPQSSDEAIFNQYRHRHALDATQSLDAYFAAYSAVEQGLELELFRAYLKNVRDPVARQILSKTVESKERHANFGWLYVAECAKKWSGNERAMVTDSIRAYLQDIELKGYHCPGFNGASKEATAAEITERAGLGAAAPAQEAVIFADYVSSVRLRLAEFGVALPALTHPQIGSI